MIDQQVRGLEGRLGGRRIIKKVQQNKCDKLNQQLREIDGQLKKAQAEASDLENQANVCEGKILKLREQMNTAQTNKEYSTFLVEVNTFKSDKGKLEEEALERMGDIEKLQEQVAELQGKLDEQQKIKAVAEHDLQARTAEVQEQLDQKKALREEAASKISPDDLLVFDRLAESHDGEAMAELSLEDKRRMEYCCGGCYMSLPVEVVTRLAPKDTLVPCPSCGRILYMGKELREEMGIKV
ncbi:MAG: zinc ribbon domain-containing protein [Planctomycetota bacterium]|jgi:predicted  nucleic acid-binding Zn-ribbon protein